MREEFTQHYCHSPVSENYDEYKRFVEEITGDPLAVIQ